MVCTFVRFIFKRTKRWQVLASIEVVQRKILQTHILIHRTKRKKNEGHIRNKYVKNELIFFLSVVKRK